MAEPLNVLFITADQWRGDCLSSLGHPTVRTPHLDALAADGAQFLNHYTVTAPCGPSRASLYTGLYLHNHRSAMNGTPLDARHTNFAIESRKRGYDPALIGYSDTSLDPRAFDPHDPLLTSYEGVLPGLTAVAKTGTDPGPWYAYLREKGYALPEQRPAVVLMRAPGPDYEDGAPVPKPFAIPAEDNDTSWHVNRAIQYTADHAKRPWMLHLSLLRPHPPWIASEPWNALYDPAAVPGYLRRETRDAEGAQHPWLAFQLSRKHFAAPERDMTLARMKAVYFGLMSEVDASLGRLFDHLKREGQWDRTLVIFTTDHGEQMGDHFLLGKSGYFDQSFHIPLIVRDPREGAVRGARISAFTESVDVMPTMLQAAGADIPPQVDGRSLQPFLSGARPRAWRDAVHWQYDFRDVSNDAAERALGLTLHQCNLTVRRTATRKYVHFAGLPPLLFDLARDPGEFTDVSGDPAYAGDLIAMMRRLLDWRMEHDDQTLTHIMLTEEGPIERRAARG
jgi:arylsulfatase A-like enzyme